MSYKRADEVLPENILEILQMYVSGEAIYVPKKKECRKRWGSSTGVNETLRVRNEQISAAILSDGKEHTEDSQGNANGTSYGAMLI